MQRTFSFLILIVVLTALAFGSGRVTAPVFTRHTLPAGVIGWTYCDEGNAARTMLDGDIFESSDTLLARETIAHEHTHRAQMIADCNRALMVYNTPRGKLVMEAQAYCVGLLTVTADGTTAYRQRRRDAISRLQAETAGSGFSDGTADAALSKVGCPS